MKRAFVFPGQGSQQPGMGRDLAEAFAPARLLFEEVDDALSQHLSRLMFEGPGERPDPDRKRPAGAARGEPRGDPRARGRGRVRHRQRWPMSPAIRSANIRRMPPPARSRSPTRRGWSSGAARRCRRRCRSARARWRRCSASTSRPRARSPPGTVGRRRLRRRQRQLPGPDRRQRPSRRGRAGRRARRRARRAALDHAAGQRALSLPADGAGRRDHGSRRSARWRCRRRASRSSPTSPPRRPAIPTKSASCSSSR